MSHQLPGERGLPDPVKRAVWHARRSVRRKLRTIALRPGRYAAAEARREELAVRYLRGEGLEIGALHRPLWVPHAERVRYVDFMSREELLSAWSDTYDRAPSVVETTDIDDGERLDTFADQSVDFVVANHLLEHAEDPVGALENWTRVLRPGGIIFLTLPDARYTFDARRPRTTVEHLLRDHREGPEVSRAQHYREWAEIIECLPQDQIPERIEQLASSQRREHFHVWELEGFLHLLSALDLPVRLEVAQAVASEFSVVLRKDGPGGVDDPRPLAG